MKNMTRTTKIVLAATAAIIVAGVSWYVFAARNDEEITADQPQQAVETADQEDGVDLNPPSEEQQQAEPEASKEQSDTNESQSANNKQDVDVVLSRVTVGNDLVTAAGYVDISTPGTCTLALKSSVRTETYSDKSQQDPANPENQNCSNFRIPKSDLAGAKKWVATLSYNADGLSGKSQKWEFEL